MADFALPGASDRTIVIGGTGTGKTVGGAWLLSKQRMDKRPFVAIDFKDEILWDLVGDPPMRNLKLGDMPKKDGLYRMHVDPGQDEELEEWLWEVWRHGNIGLFVDEATLLPQKEAMKAILRQGRSKQLPVIACTQRPVALDREFFTESGFKMIFRLDDVRDYKTVEMFNGGFDVRAPLPPHWSYWIDTKQRAMWHLRPTPEPKEIARTLRDTVPYRSLLNFK